MRWSAPEVLKRGDKDTRETDIFAFGMVVIEVGSHGQPTGEQIVYMTSISFSRFLQESIRLVT